MVRFAFTSINMVTLDEKIEGVRLAMHRELDAVNVAFEKKKQQHRCSKDKKLFDAQDEYDKYCLNTSGRWITYQESQTKLQIFLNNQQSINDLYRKLSIESTNECKNETVFIEKLYLKKLGRLHVKRQALACQFEQAAKTYEQAINAIHQRYQEDIVALELDINDEASIKRKLPLMYEDLASAARRYGSSFLDIELRVFDVLCSVLSEPNDIFPDDAFLIKEGDSFRFFKSQSDTMFNQLNQDLSVSMLRGIV